MDDTAKKILDREALRMHASGRPGKFEIHATKPLITQRDLSLAYSPGVAAPCLEIAANPELAYDLTAKGNLVAVVTNGTAVLGLGDLGAQAAKPVMEGKAVLFKRFADIDGIALEVDTRDVDEFVDCVRFLGCAFGGINLEDIKAPECFIIEQRLREAMDIPVFHDDQHGTAVITLAGFINAIDLTGRSYDDVKVVFNGAGAGAIACAELIKAIGVRSENVILCDTKGVIFEGREEGMNQWKSAHAADTKKRTLAEALEGADVFMGLSAKDVVSQEMVVSMAARPIIFAMANPDPEITPEDIKAVRDNAIIATGRSDYPNQINNVLGFPYIFRGALDVRASTINDDMKLAAARALADLAKEDVPDEVAAAYSGQHLRFGPDYIIPAPFDPRLIVAVPQAVAKAAMNSGVARKPIIDMSAYANALAARLDPAAGSLQAIFERVRGAPKRVVFAEGEEEKSIRAALAFRNAGYGTPVLIGREDRIRDSMDALGLGRADALEIDNAALSSATDTYTDYLYGKLQRRGSLRRDCRRMILRERNIFAACMVACGDADAMVTGLTRAYHVALEDISMALGTDGNVIGLTLMVSRSRTVFFADTAVNVTPDPDMIAETTIMTAAKVRQLGHEPKVALLSFSNFGHPMADKSRIVRDAVVRLEAMDVDFEFDGEMSAEVALDQDLMARVYPFCRLTGPANVLIMPDLNAASIAPQLAHKLGGGTLIGPLLIGLSHPAQIAPMGVTTSDLVTMAALAAHDAIS